LSYRLKRRLLSFPTHSKRKILPKILSSRAHVPALDGLRGIAILAVFAYHYGHGGVHSTSPVVRAFASVCDVGWSGVDLFFVLSGFLITGILYDSRNDPGYYKKFYARRALRIFPVYYLFAAIMFAIGSHWRIGHLSFLFYVGYPVALLIPSLVAIPLHITHLWSLCIEEQFYAIWPWVVARLPNPITACIIAGAVAPLLRTAIWALGWNQDWSYAFLLCRTDSLAAGAAIALLIRGGWKNVLQRWAPAAFVFSAGILLTIFMGRHTASRYDPLIDTAGFSVMAIFYGALLLISLGHGRMFSLKLLRVFGKYSYGLYLFHFPLTVLFAPLKGALSFMYVPVCLLLNLAVAAASFHLLEEPILRFKDRFTYKTESVMPLHLSPISVSSRVS
jgi:peptidoglycan/LPS O-acetylase OafA/YrhL